MIDEATQFEDLPGMAFELDSKGRVVKGFCEDCGHEFVPQAVEVTAPRTVWEVAQKSDHMTKGCKSSSASAFTALNPTE